MACGRGRRSDGGGGGGGGWWWWWWWCEEDSGESTALELDDNECVVQHICHWPDELCAGEKVDILCAYRIETVGSWSIGSTVIYMAFVQALSPPCYKSSLLRSAGLVELVGNQRHKCCVAQIAGCGASSQKNGSISPRVCLPFVRWICSSLPLLLGMGIDFRGW